MKTILVIILAVTIVINWLQFLVYAADININDIRKQSFRQQLLNSNKEYLINETQRFLKILDTINSGISNLKETQLVSWLKEGDSKEKVIVDTITGTGATPPDGLIDFREFHNNSRIDTWAKNDSPFAQFIGPFKIHAELVKYVKQKYYPDPWRFVAVHWYPYAINRSLHNDPFLKDALELTPAMWNVNDDIIQRYALFSFYRKTRHTDKLTEDFLDNETGYKLFWSVEKKKINHSRWVYPYYTYEYINPDDIPNAKANSLKSYLINKTAWLRGNSGQLDEFYGEKLELFHDTLNEMEDAIQKKESINPYWGLYSFVCQTFPCISAFKITKGKSGGYRFVKGYSGDKPAQQKFDDVRSVIGHAMHAMGFSKGGKPAKSIDIFRKTLDPILLLQFELFDITSLPNYQDVKVGFKGYLDFYNEMVCSTK